MNSIKSFRLNAVKARGVVTVSQDSYDNVEYGDSESVLHNPTESVKSENVLHNPTETVKSFRMTGSDDY